MSYGCRCGVPTIGGGMGCGGDKLYDLFSE